jgi:hemerythrin-like domain-containing protein
MTETDDERPMARSTEHLLEEHRQIHAIARQIQDAGDRNTVLPLLPELLARLERHFAGEEAPDGLFDMIRTTAPERQNSVKELEIQHRDLLTALRELIERWQPEGSEADRETVVLAHRIADDLRNHEATENNLFLDVLNTDIGVGD